MTACGSVAAIVLTLVFDMIIEEELVEARVDSGLQSTIISRETLDKIGKRLSRQGKSLPLLEAILGIKF